VSDSIIFLNFGHTVSAGVRQTHACHNHVTPPPPKVVLEVPTAVRVAPYVPQIRGVGVDR